MQCLLRCIYVQIDLLLYLFVRIIYLLNAVIYYLQRLVICNYLLKVFICNVQVFIN